MRGRARGRGGHSSHASPPAGTAPSPHAPAGSPHPAGLVSFSLPDRAPPPPRARPTRRRYVKPVSDEEYMRAKFVFVLRPGAAASTLPPSPETPIPWPCVERLILPTPLPHKLECPICLDVPNAPRITACGHVMCYPCVSRLLLHGGGAGKCPVCSKAVSAHELRPVSVCDIGTRNITALLAGVYDGPPPQGYVPGGRHEGRESRLSECVIPCVPRTVPFRLCSRNVDAATPPPPTVNTPEAEGACVVVSTSGHRRACILADLTVLRALAESTRVEIEVHSEIVTSGTPGGTAGGRRGEGGRRADPSPTLSYASVAGAASAAPAAHTHTLTSADLLDLNDTLRQHTVVIDDAMVWMTVTQGCIAALERQLDECGEGVEAATAPVAPPALVCACASAGHSPHHCTGGVIVWYQSACGEHAYLDSLSTRVLLERAGGNHAALPAHIHIPIAQLDTGPLTDAFRAKHPFLWQLPMYTTVSMCELDGYGPFAPPPASPLKAVFGKHHHLRKQALAAHSQVAKAPVTKSLSYEQQYEAMMGCAPGADMVHTPVVEVTPQEGQLHAFPVLAGGEAGAGKAPQSKPSRLQDARVSETWTFAKVIHTSGYFPELGATVGGGGGGGGKGRGGAWGKAAAPPPDTRPHPAVTQTHTGGPGGRKSDDTTLFSTGSARRRK